MKTRILSVFCAALMLLSAGCKRDNISVFHVSFTNDYIEGVVNENGEYTMTGHIFSGVSLSRVTISRQGESEAFMTDETTAKNKNEYDFSYTITGINENTTVVMDVYDQIGGRYSTQFFLIK